MDWFFPPKKERWSLMNQLGLGLMNWFSEIEKGKITQRREILVPIFGVQFDEKSIGNGKALSSTLSTQLRFFFDLLAFFYFNYSVCCEPIFWFIFLSIFLESWWENFCVSVWFIGSVSSGNHKSSRERMRVLSLDWIHPTIFEFSDLCLFDFSNFQRYAVINFYI